MSTVKFDKQEELNELQAKIYLHTNKKLSKKEILELVFKIGQQDFDKIIQMVINDENERTDDKNDMLKNWLSTPYSGGEETDSVKDHDVIN